MVSWNRLFVGAGIVLAGVLVYLKYGLNALLVYAGILIVLEVLFYVLAVSLRKRFQWLITPKDETPVIDADGLEKFMKHGFDPELGWVRKPNTSKKEAGKEGTSEYNIDEKGRRKNHGHENLPSLMSCYGDSFAFARQVNDNETWEWHLSELTKTNVSNFGVGNYGLDQALLRLKREYLQNKSKIVVMGVVPSTIVRILCLWKHYNEFGNTFAFKPMFKIRENKLILVKNLVDSKEKFFELERYIDYFRKNDYFYKIKFREDMLRFPYLVSVLSHPYRNFGLMALIAYSVLFKKEKNEEGVYGTPMKLIMDINLKLRYKLFKKDKYALRLMNCLADEFARYAKKEGFVPVFLLMPQKDDVLFIKDRGENYYANFVNAIKDKMFTIDLTKDLLNAEKLDELYSDDSKYGGHYSKKGNLFVANMVHKAMKERGSLNG